MKIALASDHAGYNLKKEIIEFLKSMGFDPVDFGTFSTESVDYPDFAFKAAKDVASGNSNYGIVICGSGVGMSMVCNKVKGIRCALVHDLFSAQATRAHNDSNVLAMGGRVVGPGLAAEIVKVWLNTEFEGDRHISRIEKISKYENA